MGGNKAQTVGYRYSLGLHLALCHGPIDAIREILVDQRTAWSVLTGSGTSGGGAAVETRIGTVAGLSATPALVGDLGAAITFPGTLPGLRIGRDYRLRLANGTDQTVTLRGVSYDAGLGRSRWTVLPEALSFATQTVQVFEATLAASSAGAGGGRIRLDKPDLFGGEGREGGIVGDVDVLMGGPAQGANDYLAARMGGAVPAWRGLCSLMLRQVYLGNNPYLKPWASGPRARPMDERWARQLRDICDRDDVAFFFKQWGGARPKSGGRLLDGEEWNGFPWKIVPEPIIRALQPEDA